MSLPVTLRGAPNNVAKEVKPCEPWDFKPNIPAEVQVDKATYRAWRSKPTTRHLVVTGYEGLNPSIRVNSSDNPAKRLHALVVDYDAKVSDAELDSVLDRCDADMQPTWLSRSPSGLGARLIWMLEESVPVEVGEMLEQFLKIVWKELKVVKIFAGPDESAFKNVSTLYDVVYRWQKLGGALSSNLIHYWLSEAAKKTAWSKIDELHIPLDDIAEEVERQYPGRWTGPFEVNARGVCFWDPTSVNTTAAIVTEAGMIGFGQAQLFHPWSMLLGGSFIRKYQADKIGGAVDGTWFDGKQYYRKIEGRWVTVAKEDFGKYLKSMKGLSDEKRGRVSSEVCDAEVFVQNQRRVHGAIPSLFDPSDVIERDGQKFLNISYIRPMSPSDTLGNWGEHFPWIGDFLDKFFDPTDQLPYFLAWWQRFYKGAVAGCLERGQNTFISGGVDIGKTLLSNRIIGGLLGGFADASDHVVRGSEFNKKLGEMALWTIDDGQVSSDPAAHRKFGEMVKKLAANPTINFRKMYNDAETQEWAGRLVCTLNDDGYSLQMIPDLSMSLEDKVLIFKAGCAKPKFPPRHILEPLIVKELPYIGRWLLEWKPPAHVLADNRFGVAQYIHAGLREAALYSGQVGDLLELVDLWIKKSDPMNKHGKIWKGTASEWLSEVGSNETLKPLIGKFTARQIGRKFVDASRIQGSRITVLEKEGHHGSGNYYQIYLNGVDPERKTVTVDPANAV